MRSTRWTVCACDVDHVWTELVHIAGGTVRARAVRPRGRRLEPLAGAAMQDYRLDQAITTDEYRKHPPRVQASRSMYWRSMYHSRYHTSICMHPITHELAQCTCVFSIKWTAARSVLARPNHVAPALPHPTACWYQFARSTPLYSPAGKISFYHIISGVLLSSASSATLEE